jgi:ABC-type glycerol-3-phosphate transport system substrate-binding protein
MKTKSCRKFLSPIARIVLILALFFNLNFSSAQASSGQKVTQSIYLPDSAPSEPYYADVLAGYRSKGYQSTSGIEVKLSGAEYSSQAESSLEVQKGIGGSSDEALVWKDSDSLGWVEWTFDVPASGLYNLGITYYPLEGRGASIQRDLKIDGAYPFMEARRISFERTWMDAAPPKQDNQGNDIRPSQVEAPRWQFSFFEDAQAMYREPYLFYLTAGQHVVRLGLVREPMAIKNISLISPPNVPSYANLKAQYDALGYAPVKNQQVIIEAETAKFKSAPTLTSNYSPNPSVNPQAWGNFKLNVFGGYRWQRPGEVVTWDFSVPETGLYQIGIKLWQGNQSRMPVYRSLMLDGKFPFDEMREIAFPYNFNWRVDTLSDSNHMPYLFYLTKGDHTITMRAIVGPASDTVRAVEGVTRELAELSRRVILLTGSSPDPLMEWDLKKEIPDLVPRLSAAADMLDNEAARLTQIGGGSRPNSANTLIEISSQLRDMAKNPNTVPNRLTQLGESQSVLGFWALDLQNGELEVDSLIVTSPDKLMPQGDAGIWAQLQMTIYNFLSSFRKQYTVVGNVYDPTTAKDAVVLDVWMARGEEWGQILKGMIEEDFTVKTGILVNLHIVPPGSLGAGDTSVLLLAATAGQAPDVALSVNPNLPVEFAIRNALYPMSKFDDFNQVTPRFPKGALVPYQYNGQTFAVPETQNFNMLFYRTDILDSLGVKPPQTWNDVHDLIWVLQQNGMDFYYPPGPDGLTPFLFQAGGDYYTADGFRSALDTPQGLSAFKNWTDLYTNYRVPQYADFFNRFKTGEMPVGVSDYWTYVLLSTAARELTGRWAMAPIPGTTMPDGTINRSAGGTGDGVVIFQQSKHPKEAWEFVKWWTSADTQVRYAIELEALLGVEARWNTANVDALNRLSWPRADIKAILEQWNWLQQRPVVLGGYFTSRHVDNAWNRVVLQGANPVEALDDAVRAINRELRKKQEEFGVNPQ